MEHHRPSMMSNGGHGGQHHHPSQHHLQQHHLQQHHQQQRQSSNDVDDLQAGIRFMSMNDMPNGVPPVNGMTSSNPNDYSAHHQSHHQQQQHPHHQQQQAPHQRQLPNSHRIYYGSVASQPPVPGPQPPVHQQFQAPAHLTHPSQQQQRQQAYPQIPSGQRSLNPCAREFIPRSVAASTGTVYRPIAPQLYQNGNQLRSGTNIMASQQQRHPQQPPQQAPHHSLATAGNSQFELDNGIEDYLALSYLKEYIYVISNKPALLNHHGLQEITTIVNTYLEEDDCVLELVVNQLVDQSIVDVNFRYSGVKICLHFIDNLFATPSGTFRDLLFKRIQRECSRKVLPNTAGTVAHMIGLSYFIADLFVSSSSEELGEALPNLLKNLLGSNATFLDENCKCVCRVLKLCGKELDDLFIKKKTDDFDNIIKKLTEIKNRDGVTDNVKELIATILKSHEDKWVSASSSSTATSTSSTAQPPKWSGPEVPKESMPAMFYGDYVEADDFEGGNIYFPSNGPMMGYDFGNGDEDNQEICEDFENFLMNLPPQSQN